MRFEIQARILQPIHVTRVNSQALNNRLKPPHFESGATAAISRRRLALNELPGCAMRVARLRLGLTFSFTSSGEDSLTYVISFQDTRRRRDCLLSAPAGTQIP